MKLKELEKYLRGYEATIIVGDEAFDVNCCDIRYLSDELLNKEVLRLEAISDVIHITLGA